MKRQNTRFNEDTEKFGGQYPDHFVSSVQDTGSSEDRIAAIVSMTQADYDALPVKQEDKLYVIVG